MKRILVVFGTRPEAIKLAPVVHELKKFPSDFQTRVCVTGQHRQMLDQVLDLFEIVPDHDINVMSPNQDLFDITTRTLIGLRDTLQKERPDLVIVQGDTTTAFVASLAAFYFKTPIGHVEAGLRTYNKYHPFPEEKNRHIVTVLADYHFAPTEQARRNLLKEAVADKCIWVTGNTGIDALLLTTSKLQDGAADARWSRYFRETWNLKLGTPDDPRRVILVTGHRRENFGDGFERICRALKGIARKNSDAKIVYPVHLNPNVRKPVFEILGSDDKGRANNIHLIEPLEYAPFVYLMTKSYLILTDSGGVQEEAPSLGKPVLVMRETTERPEGVDAGIVKLVGTGEHQIMNEAQRLLDDASYYGAMSKTANPYGDGNAAARIVEALRQSLQGA